MHNHFQKSITYICIIHLILIGIGINPTQSESNSIIKVDNEGDGDYTTIQQAVNHAKPGDTIQIYSGLYNETLIIQTEDITIKGINHELATGTDTDLPIINGNQNGYVIDIKSTACHLTSCIIQASGHDLLDAGIIIQASDTTLIGNGIVGNHYGILINNCTNNHIEGNYILANTMDGIYLLYTEKNTIKSNIIKENGFQGIFLWETQQNLLKENTISLNKKDGIQLRDNCKDNDISFNTIHSNGIDGIKIKESNIYQNTISNNDIYSNAWNGIHIINGYDNIVSDNNIYLNLLNGIHIGDADNNKIIRNTLQDNKEEGIFILWPGSTGNTIYYNNFINDNAWDFGSNTWDDTFGTGGNYWSSYTGEDDNNDGLGDTPYNIQGNYNIDNYPFIAMLYPPETPTKPSGPTLGIEGGVYTYTTHSTDNPYNRIQYGWDWDGNDEVDEWTGFYLVDEICETSHVWHTNGTYNIRVKAMDAQGFQSEWSETLTVTLSKTKAAFFHTLLLIWELILYPLIHTVIDFITHRMTG